MLPVQLKILILAVSMCSLIIKIRPPVTNFKAFTLSLLSWMFQNKPHVNWVMSILVIS